MEICLIKTFYPFSVLIAVSSCLVIDQVICKPNIKHRCFRESHTFPLHKHRLSNHLYPALFSEIHQHGNYHSQHDTPNGKISIFPSEFRYIFKIHPINPYNKCQGNKECCDDGKSLRYLTHLMIDQGEMKVLQYISTSSASFLCINS